MNPRLPVRLFVTLGFVLLICGAGLAGRAAAQVQYRTVALSGQPAPGTPAGVNYAGFGSPALNDAGQIAYVAGFNGSGVTHANGAAIYAGPLAAPQLVARTGESAPGTPAGARYESFTNLSTAPALNEAGEVSFFARLTGFGVFAANSEVFYAGPLAAPQIVARTGTPAPGTAAGVSYAGLRSAPAFNDVGQAAYHATLNGSAVTFANDEAIYAGPREGPQLVARKGAPAPGTPAGVRYWLLPSAPVLNDAGQVAYFAFLNGSGVTEANDSVIYAGLPIAPQIVAREGNAAPGMPAGVKYSALDVPVLNDASQVAYVADLSGIGVTTSNDRAIYAGPFAAPQLVAREGAPAPGTPAGVEYGNLSTFAPSPVLNDAGQLAYLATLNGSGVTGANFLAIYAGSFAAPQLVARTGDPAPGTPAGVSCVFFTGHTLNDIGQVAYLADLAGSGLTNANDRGLFASDPRFGNLLIAREGDLFDVGGGDLRTIADLGIRFVAGRSDDAPTGLSNAGTLAFTLWFTDGTRGIFTATIVPEPGALALLAFACLTLVGCLSALRRRLSAKT